MKTEIIRSIVQITPDIAQKFLDNNNEHNPRLGKMRIHWAEFLAAEMRDGKWLDEHQDPLMFRPNGDLADGQHRLKAVVISGVTIRCWVWRNVPEEYIKHEGEELPRKLHDRVKFSNEGWLNKKICEVITFAVAKESGSRKPHMSEALSMHRRFREEFKMLFESDTMKRGNFSARGIGRAAILLAGIEYLEKDEPKALHFLEAMYGDKTECQQANKLKDYLLKNKLSGGGTGAEEAYQRAICCMESHMQGVPVLKVYCRTWTE